MRHIEVGALSRGERTRVRRAVYLGGVCPVVGLPQEHLM